MQQYKVSAAIIVTTLQMLKLSSQVLRSVILLTFDSLRLTFRFCIDNDYIASQWCVGHVWRHCLLS